jgi:hypothetical protein
MYDLIRRWTLSLLKAPPQPHPPIGDPASLRIFNAGKNYFRLRIARWTLVELAAFGGLIFWTAFLIDIGNLMREEREKRTQMETEAAQVRDSSSQTLDASSDIHIEATVGKKHSKHQQFPTSVSGFRHACADFALKLPAGAFALIWAIKIFSAVAFLVQLPITYAIRRLDYEMRWYMVTDRSLRLRYGVWKISEATMSFANIQQVVVSQGPLQRLLGLGDVRVKSAGGGGGKSGDGQGHSCGADDMHTGLFHCVTNATEIRDLIIERLRRFREAGLGDPDDKNHALSPTDLNQTDSSTLSAARELVVEARALRAALKIKT